MPSTELKLTESSPHFLLNQCSGDILVTGKASVTGSKAKVQSDRKRKEEGSSISPLLVASSFDCLTYDGSMSRGQTCSRCIESVYAFHLSRNAVDSIIIDF